MRRFTIRFSVLMILMVSLSGCYLKSVHPLITIENSILVEGLDGIYETEDQQWIFASDNSPDLFNQIIRQTPGYEESDEPEKLGISAYVVLFKNKQAYNYQPVVFLGTVGEINDEYYLNLKILDFEMSSEEAPFIKSHLFNVNTFSKLKVEDDTLSMQPLASNWLTDQIVNNRVRIKHEKVASELSDTSEILVTASTEELQEFIEKYGKVEDAYESAIELPKVSNAVN